MGDVTIQSDISSYTAVKITTAALFGIAPMVELGIYADYFLHSGGERCLKGGGDKACKDNEDDLPSVIQTGVLARISF